MIPRFTVERVLPNVPRGGLAALSEVELDARNQRMLEGAAAGVQGSPIWRGRKIAEVREVLCLDQIADRFAVIDVDARETLHVAAKMNVPVACMDRPGGDLTVHRMALLGISYPEKAVRAPQPGYAFVQILAPHPVWHANVAADHGQPLCLGPALPAGIRLKEIVLMTYAALSMQAVMIDARDPAGVLNAKAGEWWQRHLDRIPLTRAAFLDPADAGPA